MFVRFVTSGTHPDSHRRRGIFQAAYALRRSDRLSPVDAVWLQDVLSWFEDDLERPVTFVRSRYAKGPTAICWFRDSARAHVARAHEMACILRAYGEHVARIRTRRPGWVVYQDPHQVAAVPFRDTPA